MSERPRLRLREKVLVEDWIGPDADGRRERGEPPDRVYEEERVYDLATGEELREGKDATD